MRTTEILREEHDCIRLLLDALDRLVAGARERGTLDAEAAAELLVLFEHFVDGQHQEKEEWHVLPTLLERASGADEERLLELLQDHGTERDRMRSLRAGFAAALAGAEPALAAFAREATAYVELHRAHAAHEEAELFPLIEALFDDEDDHAVVEGFRDIEAAGPDPAGVLERARSLARRLGVPPRA